MLDEDLTNEPMETLSAWRDGAGVVRWRLQGGVEASGFVDEGRAGGDGGGGDLGVG
jgi:hypothetical protein